MVTAYWRLAAGGLISLFFLWWAWRLIGGIEAMAVSLAQANYLFLGPAVLVYFVGVWLRAIRWRALLHPVRSISARRLFPVVVIGYMANDVLPARLGELIRAYVLGEQEGVPTTTTLGTILVERLFDGIAMLIFVGAVGFLVPLGSQISSIFRLAAILFVGALIGLGVVVSSPERALRLTGLLDRMLPSPLQGRFGLIARRFLRGLECLQSGRLCVAILALSVGAWLCEATMYLVVALGFGLRLGFPAYMLTAAVANLGAMIPAAPGYVGTFDVGALSSLQLFGVSPGQAAGYVVVLHLALLGPVTFLGFFYLWRANLSLRRLGQRVSVGTTKEAAH